MWIQIWTWDDQNKNPWRGIWRIGIFWRIFLKHQQKVLDFRICPRKICVSFSYRYPLVCKPALADCCFSTWICWRCLAAMALSSWSINLLPGHSWSWTGGWKFWIASHPPQYLQPQMVHTERLLATSTAYFHPFLLPVFSACFLLRDSAQRISSHIRDGRRRHVVRPAAVLMFMKEISL